MSKWKIEVRQTVTEWAKGKGDDKSPVEIPRDVVKHLTVSGAQNAKEAEAAALRRMGKKADGHKGIKSSEVDDDCPNAPTHIDLTPPVCHSCGRTLQEVTT